MQCRQNKYSGQSLKEEASSVSSLHFGSSQAFDLKSEKVGEVEVGPEVYSKSFSTKSLGFAQREIRTLKCEGKKTRVIRICDYLSELITV